MSILSLLNWDSFASIWFWMILLGQWIISGIHIIGIPLDVLEPGHPEAKPVISFRIKRHLQWVETMPFALTFAIGIGLGCLAVLAVHFKAEFAQALMIILLPKCVCTVMAYKTCTKIRGWALADQCKTLKKLHFIQQGMGMLVIFGASIFAVSQHLDFQF